MSRRTLTPIVEESEEESDGSLPEINLSYESYRTTAGSQITSGGSDSSVRDVDSSNESNSFRSGSSRTSRPVHPSHRLVSRSPPREVPSTRTGSSGVPDMSQLWALMQTGQQQEERFPHFKDDHFAAVHPRYDEPELAQMFGEETGTTGSGGMSSNVDQDIDLLRDLGFHIDYTSDGHLGEGYYGSVYRGYYGPSVQGMKDIRALQPFAVKMIDFAADEISDSDSYASNSTEILERRECYETEKWILTSVFHKNLCTTRQIINMGEQRPFQFLHNKDNWYLSPDRIYIIMDYADGGELEDWWQRHGKGIDPFLRISLLRQLFAGLLHLHSLGIIHGDIHPGNVLMYMEHGQWVPKWADFGLGFVDAKKQFRFRATQMTFMERARVDLQKMALVFKRLLTSRQKNKELPEESKTLDDINDMVNWISKTKPTEINEIFDKYRNALEERLDIQEDYF